MFCDAYAMCLCFLCLKVHTSFSIASPHLVCVCAILYYNYSVVCRLIVVVQCACTHYSVKLIILHVCGYCSLNYIVTFES